MQTIPLGFHGPKESIYECMGDIILPSKEWAMGLRDCKSWNVALITKLAWNVASETDNLWITRVHHYYLRKKSIWTCPSSTIDNWYWRKLLVVRDKMNDCFVVDSVECMLNYTSIIQGMAITN